MFINPHCSNSEANEFLHRTCLECLNLSFFTELLLRLSLDDGTLSAIQTASWFWEPFLLCVSVPTPSAPILVYQKHSHKVGALSSTFPLSQGLALRNMVRLGCWCPLKHRSCPSCRPSSPKQSCAFQQASCTERKDLGLYVLFPIPQIHSCVSVCLCVTQSRLFLADR